MRRSLRGDEAFGRSSVENKRNVAFSIHSIAREPQQAYAGCIRGMNFSKSTV